MSSKRSLSSAALCVKYLLFASNFILFAAGCALLGVCLWIVLERDFVSAMVGDALMTVAAFLLIVAGAIVMLLSFFGCCGSVLENRCMLLTYFATLLLLFLTLVTAGVLAVVFKAEINEEMRGSMRSILSNDYGINLDDSYNRAVTNGWDAAQQYLYCCSIEDQSWGLYRDSKWFHSLPGIEGERKYVPASCCVRDQYGVYVDLEKCQQTSDAPPGTPSPSHRNEALHYRGCFPAAKDFVKEYAGYIAGLGFGVAVFMLVGMSFAMYLYFQLARY